MYRIGWINNRIILTRVNAKIHPMLIYEEHHAGGIPRIVTLLSARSDGYTVRNLP